MQRSENAGVGSGRGAAVKLKSLTTQLFVYSSTFITIRCYLIFFERIQFHFYCLLLMTGLPASLVLQKPSTGFGSHYHNAQLTFN